METNEQICREIATQENFNVSQCSVRVIRRNPDGDAQKVLLKHPNGQTTFYQFPTIMFGNTFGYMWRKDN
jgi:phage portal protein BeeE